MGADEAIIYQDLVEGGMSREAAVRDLCGLGYAPSEAERVVSEWIEGLEANSGKDPRFV